MLCQAVWLFSSLIAAWNSPQRWRAWRKTGFRVSKIRVNRRHLRKIVFCVVCPFLRQVNCGDSRELTPSRRAARLALQPHMEKILVTGANGLQIGRAHV